MFGKALKVLNLFGFEVKIDLSWIFILLLVTWSLASAVFPRQVEGLETGIYWFMAFLAAVGLFFSIVLHEFCHSLMARRCGMPMKGITLFLFGGVAEMQEEPPSPKAEFLMTAAGPLCTVVMAAIFWGLSVLGQNAGWSTPVTAVLQWLALLNTILLVFNLFPGFPLDGGRILRAILWHFKGDLRWATRISSRVGSGFAFVLIGLGFLELILGGFIGGLWFILIGLFLNNAAQQGYQQVLVRQVLEGEPVRRFMKEDPVTIAPTISLDEFVNNYAYKYHHKLFPVVKGDELAGCLYVDKIKRFSRDQWPEHEVDELIEGCGEENSVSPDEDAVSVLQKMNRTNRSRMLVLRNNHLEGIITLKDLLQFLSMKLDLEYDEPPKAAAGIRPESS